MSDIKVYDMEVKCGQYCYGGSVKPEETNYPDEYSWVRYPDYERLRAALVEAERDAKRYRELRRQCDLKNYERAIFICPPAPAAACASGDELDHAVDFEIDAAGGK